MKTSLLIPGFICCVFLSLPMPAASDAAAGWQAELAAAQQTSHQDAGGRTRADVILRAVFIAANDGLPAALPSAGANLEAAAAQAAYSALAVLYPNRIAALDTRLTESLAGLVDTPAAISAGREWGRRVAAAVLASQSDAVFLNASSFAREAKAPVLPSPVPDRHAEQASISPGRYRFRVLAGAAGTQGYVDATGDAARFNPPGGMVADAAGNLYLSDRANSTIRKVSPEGVVTTFAGTPGGQGRQDGTAAAAQFSQPTGLAMDGVGNIYVADAGNHTIRKIDPLGRVTTVAGKAGEPGGQDGPRESARLFSPTSLAIDPSGNLLVIQAGSIRKVAPDGSVTSPRVPNLARFWPLLLQRIQADSAGNLYVTYWHSGPMEDVTDVLRLTPQASGEDYTATALVPPGSNSYMAHGDGVDGAGRIFMTGYGEPTYVYTPDGAWQVRYAADGMERGWDYPGNDIAVGPAGELYVFRSEYNEYALYGIGRPGAIEVGVFDPAATDLVIIEWPREQYPYRGENAKFEVKAIGGPALAFQWYFNSQPINGATGSFLALQDVQDKDVGSYSVVVSEGGSSRTSGSVKLSVRDYTFVPASVSGTSASLPGTGSSLPPPSAGGGGIDPGMALAVLMLLAAAAGGFRHCRPRGSWYGGDHE